MKTGLQKGPRMLCLYHTDSYWRHAVAWMEHRVEGETLSPFALHIVCTNASGRVMYIKRPASEARYLYPTKVKTTVGQFVAYLCRRLLVKGGDAWNALGMERPVQEPTPGEARPMSDDLAEAYERAARLLGTSVEDLEKKYGHLNNGLQMMNLRNRLRAKGHNV